MSREKAIRDYFGALIRQWGPQDWWPAHTAFEVITGAYLTQNTAWINVEHALRSLRRAGALSVDGIRRSSLPRLQQLVRPAGYFRQKAERIKLFVQYLDDRYSGSLKQMFRRPTRELREELLSLKGIGPETADSILLYAGGHASFVVDAYTRRVFERHGVLKGTERYEEIRELFERALERQAEPRWQAAGFRPAAVLPGRRRHKFRITTVHRSARLFDEYHALLVQVAKHHCFKKAPKCDGCPLQAFLPPGGPAEVKAIRRTRPGKMKRRGTGR